MKRIAIIGGGISGLAAAWELAHPADCQSGEVPPCAITLFEASQRVGGVLETLHDGPYLVERSADNFATLIPEALELSRQAGLADELIGPAVENRQALVLSRNGRLLPIPAGFSLMQPTRVASILTSGTLSWRGKLRLLREFWVAARDSDEDESLESFATRRLGREAYESLVEPIVSGIFTADPSTLSMQATMPQFVEMERRYGGLMRGHLAARRRDSAEAARRASGARYDQFMAPRNGMSDWVSGLAQRLPPQSLRLNTRIQSLARQTNGWQVNSAQGLEDFDAVICATPAAVTADLLQPIDAAAAALVAGIPYASSSVVAMIVDRSELTGRTDAFGLIVPRRSGLETLAISFSSNKYPGRVPEGQILLRIFLGGALRGELVDLPDEQLVDLATRELRSLLGWTGQRPRWQAVIRWPNAMPQYLIGHTQRVKQLEEDLRKKFPTLKLCGAAYSGVGIPQCVRSGRQAARAVLQAL